MKTVYNKKVFAGENSMLDFVNPANSITPLVEIHKNINPFYTDGVRFYAKLLQFSPLAQVKSIPAYEMLIQANARNEINGKDTIIEASSGNTSYGLSVISRLLSINNIEAYVSHEISDKKISLLRLFGIKAKVFEDPLCADATDPESRIYKARDAGKIKNIYNPGQYSNIDNPSSHYKYTAKQIWEQTNGEIAIFCCGLGTSGTFSGCSMFLKEKNEKIHCIAGLRSENNMVPGLRTENQMREIDFPWKEYLDASIKISSIDSYANSLDLIRYGIIAGPSSGLAFATAKEYIGILKKDNKLEKLKNQEGYINVIFICCDFPYLYLNEYFQYLDPSSFPNIENEQLLRERGEHNTPQTIPTVKELSSHEVFDLAFNESPEKVWGQIKHKEKIELKKDVSIIDVRNESEYEDRHVPESVHVPFHDLDTFLQKNKKELSKNNAVIFVCRRGNTSRLAAHKAEQLGIKSISLKGGDAEWSRLNLPRIRPEKCILRFDL